MKPKLLDLFCGAGGAAMGYARAGFDVTGVDIREQPSYPFPMVLGDALAVLSERGHLYDVIHASPPCQAYSSAVTSADSRWIHHSRGRNEPRLIAATRDLLLELGRLYVIENVVGARSELRDPVLLCGRMFDAHPTRHRLFETNWGLEQPDHAPCRGWDKDYAEAAGIDYRDMSVTGKSRRRGSIETWRQLMGMPWAGRGYDLTEAIPPRYTAWVGSQMLAAWTAANGGARSMEPTT